MILTSNRGFSEWGEIFGDPVVATALLDRLLHYAIVIPIEGNSYRLREHAALIPEHLRNRPAFNEMGSPVPKKRRPGRPKRRKPRHCRVDFPLPRVGKFALADMRKLGVLTHFV